VNELEELASALDVPLIGPTVSMLPLRREHAEGLLRAADPSLWRYSLAMPIETKRDAEAFVAEAMSARASSREVPFAIVHNRDGSVVGTSRYMQIEPEYASIEIGMTWIASRYHGKGVNPAAKLLLLTHAMEVARVVRVEFQVDHRNERSRAALSKIGATYEGTLRRYHAHARNGYERNTMVFSVIDLEWLHVRERLANIVRMSEEPA